MTAYKILLVITKRKLIFEVGARNRQEMKKNRGVGQIEADHENWCGGFLSPSEKYEFVNNQMLVIINS